MKNNVKTIMTIILMKKIIIMKKENIEMIM